METIDLYKFVNDNSIEYHKSSTVADEMYLFVPNYLLDKWNKLLGACITDDDGLNCVMKDGYFCFEMKYICEYYDIEIKQIFDFERIGY